MKLTSLATVTLLLSTWIMSAAAHADTVLYDGTGFVVGTQSFVQSFDLATPGTIKVTLTNVAWPEQLASLNMLLGSASGAMGPEMGAGTATFNVKAGDVFAQWFGTAQGPLDAGVYSMKIDFIPAGQTVVPLPTSLGLLLSGLALLAWYRRRAGVNAGAGGPGGADDALARGMAEAWNSRGAPSSR